MEELRVDFLLECASGQAGRGSAQVVRVSPQKAFKAGLRMCLGIWAIGAVTIFIPLVHFVSVPLFFMLGPVAGKIFANFQKAQAEYEDVMASCPDCAHPLSFSAESGIEPPQQVKCPGCGHVIVILRDRSKVPA